MALTPASTRLSFAVLLTAAGLSASSAHAEGTVTSALSWIRLPGAESCITTPELGVRIEGHLGRPVLVSPTAADVSIEARVARTAARDPRYKAVVGGTRRDGTPIGTREIVSPTNDCRSLDDGLVLVIALMIDPDALAPAPREAQPAPPPVSPAVTREIVHERVVVHEVERVPAQSPPWIVQGALSGGASFARLPGVAPATGLSLRAGPSRLVAFEVSFGVVPSQTLEVGARAVDYTLLEGGLAFCPTVAFGMRVDVGGCLGARVGAIRSRGRGFGADREVDRGLADIGIGPRVTVGIAGPVFALASAAALVPLVRQETTVTDAGSVVVLDRRGALGGEVGIGVGVRFSP